MNAFLVITLTALLCATVTIAAPADAPIPIAVIIDAIKCREAVAVDSLSGTGHENVFAEYQNAFADAIRNLKHCGDSNQSCILVEIEKFQLITDEFLWEMFKVDEKLAKHIALEWPAKCSVHQ